MGMYFYDIRKDVNRDFKIKNDTVPDKQNSSDLNKVHLLKV